MIRNRRALYRRIFSRYGIGAEIGVRYGDNAQHLFAEAKPRTLYLVDTWGHRPGALDHDNSRLRQMYRGVKRRFARYARIHVLPLASIRAARLFDPHSFDWVYIDAAHDYQSVTDDITAWWPLVRPGGWLAGHDYLDRAPDYGVKRAVDRFAGDRDLEVGVTGKPGYSSWYIQRPRQS